MSSDRVDQLGAELDLVSREFDQPPWEREYRFADATHLACCPIFMTEYTVPRPRKYRFDFASPRLMLAVEYEGGVGRGDVGHTSVSQIKRDIEKSRLAAMLGWWVLRFHHDDVRGGQALFLLDALFDVRLGSWGTKDDQFYRPEFVDGLITAGLAVPWE
jgi:hypothetical protein